MGAIPELISPKGSGLWLNPLTDVEDQHPHPGNQQGLPQTDLAKNLGRDAKRHDQEAKQLDRAAEGIAVIHGGEPHRPTSQVKRGGPMLLARVLSGWSAASLVVSGPSPASG